MKDYEKAFRELRDLGKRVEKLRAEMAPDSPLNAPAFRLASLLGEIEAIISIDTPAPAALPRRPDHD